MIQKNAERRLILLIHIKDIITSEHQWIWQSFNNDFPLHQLLLYRKEIQRKNGIKLADHF